MAYSVIDELILQKIITEKSNSKEEEDETEKSKKIYTIFLSRYGIIKK